MAAQTVNKRKELNMKSFDKALYDFFVVTEESAFNTYKLYKAHKQWYTLAEIYERIKSNSDIFENLSQIDVEKVREAILPAFLKDGLIEEYNGGFRALKGNIMIGSIEEKYSLIKNLNNWISDATEKVNEGNFENTNFCVSIIKKARKSDYEKLKNKLMDISTELVSLLECPDESEETVSFDFVIYFSHENHITKKS